MACTETARIAQLVARQRSSKRKTGRQVNCQMRVKKTMPFFLEGKVFSHAKNFKPINEYTDIWGYGNITCIHDKHIFVNILYVKDEILKLLFPFEIK